METAWMCRPFLRPWGPGCVRTSRRPGMPPQKLAKWRSSWSADGRVFGHGNLRPGRPPGGTARLDPGGSGGAAEPRCHRHGGGRPAAVAAVAAGAGGPLGGPPGGADERPQRLHRMPASPGLGVELLGRRRALLGVGRRCSASPCPSASSPCRPAGCPGPAPWRPWRSRRRARRPRPPWRRSRASDSPTLSQLDDPRRLLAIAASIFSAVSFAAAALRWASDRTSSATTANPAPASPARAASTAALRARMLVWKAISSIFFTIFATSALEASMACIAVFISAIVWPPRLGSHRAPDTRNPWPCRRFRPCCGS